MEKTERRTNHLWIKLAAILAVCVMLLVGVSLLHPADSALAVETAEQTLKVGSGGTDNPVVVNRGAEFDVDITIGNNSSGIQALMLYVGFDPSAMTLLEVTPKEPDENENWTSDFMASGKDEDETYSSYGVKRMRLVWATRKVWTGEGVIATLHFLAKPKAKAKEYQITVDVDTNNTLLSGGQNCDIAVTGGTVSMLVGAYSVFLYDANGNEHAYTESNEKTVTISDALATIEGYTPEEEEKFLPTKAASKKYKYTFRGWRELQSGDHAVYEPTFTAIPIPYDITFNVGVLYDGEDEILFEGEVEDADPNTTKKTVQVPYAKIINYDAEVPAPFDEHYSFQGWYKDAACTQMVDFATMPVPDDTDKGINVYGYFSINEDDPNVTSTTLCVETEFKREGEDDNLEDYLYASVSIAENFGINSIRFAPTFDSTKLEFVGFYYDSTDLLYHEFGAVFPDINANIAANGNAVDEWQISEVEDLSDKKYLFINVASNVFKTGRLITFKFKVKGTGESTVGLDIGTRDVTRYDAAGGIYYANAIVESAKVNVVRVVKPTPYTTVEKTYTYDPTGAFVTYEFKNKGGYNYYELSGASHDRVGNYTATATLRSDLGDTTLITWADGTTDPLDFEYEIKPYVVTKPVAKGDEEYIFSNSPKYFAFTSASTVHSAYYTITEGTDVQTKAGEYTVRVNLTSMVDDNDNNDDNFMWEGGTTGELTFPFKIEKREVVMPTPSEEDYRFNPGVSAPTTFNNDGEAVTYAFKAEDADTKGYYSVSDNLTQSAVGEYKVVVSLLYPDDTVWKDAEEGKETDDVEYDFVIGKYRLTTPTVRPKTYTGSPLTAEVDLSGYKPYEVSQEEHTDSGDYDVIFTIKAEFKGKYEWIEPIGNEEPDSLSAKAIFVISGVEVNEWTTTPSVASKTYNGAPVVPEGASKYGTPTVRYRLQSDTVYSNEAPVNAGRYYAEFSVAQGENDSYPALSYDPVPFEIYKAELTKPTEDSETTYTYTGDPITYVFEQAGSADKYTVSGHVQTNAGNYTVSVAIKDEYKANYYWSDKTTAALEFEFVINKVQLAIPVPDAERAYVYNGAEQTFEFKTVEYSDRYTISGNKHKEPGVYTVTARIENKKKANYEWADGTTDDKTYEFKIRYASLTRTTDSGANEVTVTVSTAAGLDANSAFTVVKKEIDASELLATIANANKKGALGQLTDEAAAALVENKCLVVSLFVQLTPAPVSGEYLTEITLPVARDGVVVLRFVGEDVEVFSVRKTGEKTIAFDADGVSDYVILADHSYNYEVVDEAYLVSGATCDSAAIYYKSCSCGATNGVDTFAYGEALGHLYNFDDITWVWSADHLSATAKVVCSRDASHVLLFEGDQVKVNVISNVPAAVDRNGRIERKASFVYDDVTYYSDIDVEIVLAGHVYTAEPVWPDDDYVKTNGTSSIKATFTCDCGESVVTRDATVTMQETLEELIYTAEVEFQGKKYQKEYRIDHPFVLFVYSEEDEISSLLLPGDSVPFADETGHEINGYLFVGWRDEAGALIVQNAEGNFFEYKIGFESLTFTAVWKKLTTVTVSVTDTDGAPVEGAKVLLYDSETVVLDEHNEIVPAAVLFTEESGEVLFPSIPYGNYKLVVTFPYTDGVDIVRSSYLDVDRPEGVKATIVLPRSKFNTVLDGIGSAEGLDGAISEEEKNRITDGTTGGTINEIVITQKRVSDVSDEIKEQITQEVNRAGEYKNGELVDFYEITMVKQTTIRNANGEQYCIQDNIKETVNYQTNIFPLSTALKQKIVEVGGTVENVFVYKRHTYDTGVMVIFNLPKLDEATGATAEMECFFIKRVAGEEYIAIRQREYSELAFGVSPDPILNANEITKLYLPDRVYGDTTEMLPVVRARYGEDTAVITYSSTEDGEYTSKQPTNAGTYYIKAYIPAASGYAAAERVYSFTIQKKVVARPEGDTETKFVYNGEDQTYQIEESDDYVVSGNVQKNAGRYVVTVALADPANTIWDSGLATDLSFDFVIDKKKLVDIGSINFEDKEFWFNGKAHSIEISGELPEGVEVVYEGNEESELGKFTVTAVFKSDNPNYDVSDPMTAVMHIRLNWIPILILILVALTIIIVVIVIVERMLKKEKQGDNPPPDSGDGGGSAGEQENGTEEGTNND